MQVNTSNPAGFLGAIKKPVDSKEFDTWSHDKEGDFTPTPDQWCDQA